MKFEFSSQILDEYSKYQISWKYVQWEPSFSMLTSDEHETDVQEEAKSRFSQYREHAPKTQRLCARRVNIKQFYVLPPQCI